METLMELVDRAAETRDSGVELVDRREQSTFLTWSTIREQARAVAAALREDGIQPGDRVALCLPTGTDHILGFFGILLAGAVPVPLYPPVRIGRLDEYHEQTVAMLRTASVSLMLTIPRIAAVLGDVPRRAALPRPLARVRDLAQRGAGSQRNLMAPAASRDDLALVQFSSGTATTPKAVALTHRALVAQLDALATMWPRPRGGRHRGVSWLPLYHDMGLIGFLLGALHHCGTVTLLPPELFVARPASWLRAISRTRSTISAAPDFAYALCVEKIADTELSDVDLGCWQVALDGAEMVSARTLRAFAQRFARWGFDGNALSPVYGLSEASLAVTFSNLEGPWRSRRFARRALDEDRRAEPADDGREIASVGRPLPGFSIRIVDEDRRDQAPGTIGRILVQGPSLLREYLDDPTATRQVLRDSWLDTGDLGFRLEEELYIVGRAKDILIHRGRNLAADEIERAVEGVPGYRSGCAAVVGWLADGASAERIELLVERRRNRTVPDEDLALHCQQRVLERIGLALDAVRVLPPGSLPRTSSGKIRRQDALARLRAGTLGPAPGHVGWRLLAATARAGLSRVLPVRRRD